MPPSPLPIADPIPSPAPDRYSRQTLFPGIGLAGQALLAHARVTIIGVGATGAATASLLARAGVGHLTLIDRDVVEYSNLQRQILFEEADAQDATPKAEAARHHLALINSSIQVQAVIADLVPANIAALLANAHLLLDCTDNFETRYLLNDYAIQNSIPWIYAAAVGSYAATMNILPNHTACLACIFPAPPSGPVDTCDTAGILSTAVNLAASLQTTEALKFLTHQPALMRRTLVSYDLWTARHTAISTARPNPECEVCAQRIFRHLAGQHRPQITLCGRNAVQIHERNRPLDLTILHASLAAHPDITDVRSNPLLLRFQRGPHTVTIFPDGRALIQGTTDPVIARSLYARFIGS